MYFEAIDDAVTLYKRKNGVTQEQLAADMGMAPNTFSWKLRGEREFTLEEATRLCDLIGVDIVEIVRRQKDEFGFPPKAKAAS